MEMEFLRKLPTPQELKEQFPVSEKIKEIKETRDKEIKEIFTEDDAPKLPAKTTKAAKAPKATAPEPAKEETLAKTYTKEEVRGVLSAKANAENGKFKAAVKDIVKKYGNGGSLTNVDAKDYAALVADVEALA